MENDSSDKINNKRQWNRHSSGEMNDLCGQICRLVVEVDPTEVGGTIRHTLERMGISSSGRQIMRCD